MDTMTAGQIIEALSQMDPDTPVVHVLNEGMDPGDLIVNPITGVKAGMADYDSPVIMLVGDE